MLGVFRNGKAFRMRWEAYILGVFVSYQGLYDG